MYVSPTPLLLLHTFLSIGSLCMSDEFRFNGFSGTGSSSSSRIHLNGDSQIEQNGILRLTSDTPSILGHAFYEAPIRFKNSTNGKAFSFSTAFAFAIVPEYQKLGGHGFAFTVSKSREMAEALPRQYLGLMNATEFGNFSNHVFAVEFDTVQNFEFGDINDNHVGIDLNSLVSNTSVDASYLIQCNSREQGFNLKSGKVIQAWIDYDSSREELDVTLSGSSSKPSSPILSFPVDLSPIFLDYMYVGFSASTGLLASSHYILGWSFTMNGETRSLDLFSLPSIPGMEQSHLPVTLGTSLSVGIVFVLAVLTTLYTVKKIKNKDVIESWELEVGPHRFSYKELQNATQGFRDEELLGFGGFGSVYKGTLPNSSTRVAVKRINHKSKQGLREFVSEITSIGRLRHRNLVALRGWCRHRSDLLLVYDFMPNGSLDKYLFDEPKIVLTWEQRFKILKGVASGLLYLHEGWEQTVIHRDIKAGNVLLDSEMNSKLGDFGLAKLYEHGENPSTTKVVGTLGYLAPELTKTGKPTTHSDVFAFGALLLETVCGRRPIEAKAWPEELVLVDWLWEKWRRGCVLEVVDPRLNRVYNELEVLVVIKVGLMCLNNNPTRRPSMRQVVRYLEGEVPVGAPDEFDGKDVKGLEDSENSSSSTLSSYCTYEYNRGEDVDLEAGSMSTTFSSKGGRYVS